MGIIHKRWPIDLAVRYGGDEFAVVLIDSDKGMAEQVAQRIETGLRSDPNEPALGVSIGIAIYPYDGGTVAELIEAADRQLYKCRERRIDGLFRPRDNSFTASESGVDTRERGRPPF